MKVMTVRASVRFSKAIGEGQHKTVGLGEEATLDARETCTEAQASLYHLLGQQIKTLWNGNQASSDGGQTQRQARQSTTASSMTQSSSGLRRKGRVWCSHKAPDGKGCKER